MEHVHVRRKIEDHRNKIEVAFTAACSEHL